MVSIKDFVVTCGTGDNESVTFTVKVKVPVAVGVPEMVPVELRVRPGGNDPAETTQDSGTHPPLAWRVCGL